MHMMLQLKTHVKSWTHCRWTGAGLLKKQHGRGREHPKSCLKLSSPQKSPWNSWFEQCFLVFMSILLMEEILHHLGCFWNPINNGINYLSTGARFQPATVVTIRSATVFSIWLYRLASLTFKLREPVTNHSHQLSIVTWRTPGNSKTHWSLVINHHPTHLRPWVLHLERHKIVHLDGWQLCSWQRFWSELGEECCKAHIFMANQPPRLTYPPQK